MTKLRLLSTLASLALVVLTAGAAAADVIGKTQQPLVAGEPVTLERQRELGLVQVTSGGGSCSGVLLNRYWVLTADHCVTTDGKIGGPDQALASIVVSAAWTKQKAEAIRVVRFAKSRGFDVALVFMINDIGAAATKLIYHNEIDTSMSLTVFGQGLCAFASGEGKSAKPAERDCGYRSAVFKPDDVAEDTITLVPNDHGQIPNAGDSGGPLFVTDPTSGAVLSLASVHSGGKPSGWVKGHEKEKAWVTGIEFSRSVPLYPLRADILNTIKEEPPFADARTKPPSGDVYASGFPTPRGPIGPGGGGVYTSPDAKPKAPPPPPVPANPTMPPQTDPPAPGRQDAHDTFSGDWNTVTAAGNRYVMKLIQRRRGVSGTYTHPDGRIAGMITGRISGNTLTYQWQEEGGGEGSGRFELADDGNTFQGWWSYSQDPEDVEGSWNGTRK